MCILTAEQQEIKKAAKEFVAKYIIPNAAEYDRKGEFHPFLLEAAKESKIFTMAIPKKYGGVGYDALTQAVVEELRVPVASVRLVMGDTDLTPTDIGTVGSMTTPRMWPQIRKAAATAAGMPKPMAPAIGASSRCGGANGMTR